MKYLFLLPFFLLFTLASFAQSLSFSEAIQSNTPQSELKKRANNWMISNTDYTETQSNVFVGKSSTVYNPTIFYGSSGTKGVIDYKVIITVLDNGYKYEITKFTHTGNENNTVNLSFGELTINEDCPRHIKGQRKGWENKVWAELKDVSTNHAKDVAESIKTVMNTQSEL